MCGFDMRRGHRLKTRIGSATEMDDEGLGDLPVHGVAALDYAERQIARDKLEQQRLGTGVPWWMIFLALVGLVSFAVGMVSMPQDQVMLNSGYILWGAGGLLSFYFSLRIVVGAFQEAPLQGLLVIIVPFYMLYYIFTRWDRVGAWFLFSLVGGVLQGAGYAAVVSLVPMFEQMMRDRKKDDYSMRPWHHRPVVTLVCRDTESA